MVHPRSVPPASTGVTHARARELSVRELPALLERVHTDLVARRQVLDDLNVFPVPDGDTGTNLVLTVRSSLTALQAVEGASGATQSREVIRGAVRGARGNSGVILSQVIRAVVEELSGRTRIDAATYAEALQRAASLAYEAVAEPVEGTILTAIGAAARAARAAVDSGADLVQTSASTCEAVAEAVQASPRHLEILRRAGVVDAGARGFEVVLAAVHGHITGETWPVQLDARTPQVPVELEHPGGTSNPFEVQYLLDAADEHASEIRRALEGLGDSVVVVSDGGLLNVHVHTDRIGDAIELGLKYGRPSDIEVTHLEGQIAARPQLALAETGAVAVLDGPGVDGLVDGPYVETVATGTGQLPAVAALIRAIDRVPARAVLVLPGDRAAVSIAHQAVGELGPARRAHVIEAADTPPAVFAVIAVLDPDSPIEVARVAAEDAARAVRAGKVVIATQDERTSIGQVTAGQSLTVIDDEVVGADHDLVGASTLLAERLEVRTAELVTVLVGASVRSEERARILTHLEAVGAQAEIEVIDLGQHPVRLWVGVQ